MGGGAATGLRQGKKAVALTESGSPSARRGHAWCNMNECPQGRTCSAAMHLLQTGKHKCRMCSVHRLMTPPPPLAALRASLWLVPQTLG
jgi:hypothetical protein